MRRLVSNALVALLVAYALAGAVFAASALWQPAGTLGFVAGYAGIVRSVAPGGPAAQTGVAVGDRLVFGATPLAQRRFVSGIGTPVPIGTVVPVAIVHDGATRALRLRAVAADPTLAERSTLLFTVLAALIFIGVGAALIVLHPSAATWGFGCYCLLDAPTGIGLPFPDAVGALVATLAYDVLQNLGIVGLVLFALDFPRPIDRPWRARLRRALPALFVVLALMTLYPDVANLLLAMSAQHENRLLQVLFGATFALAVAVLFDTFRRSAIDQRERVRWVLLGFGVGLFGSYLGTTLLYSTLFDAAPPASVVDTLVSLNVLLPLTVAHAVVRHRVLDIDVVIGRAVVFAALTSVLAGIFGILDWLFGTVLEDFRLSRFVAAAIAIGAALVLNRIEKRADAAVEAVFFRKRRAARGRLERAVHSLPLATAGEAIEAVLVRDVAEALELTWAAFYRRGASGFARSTTVGSEGALSATIGDGDALLQTLRRAPHALRLAERNRHRGVVAADSRAPKIALPVRGGGELSAFALYGGHRNGDPFDAEELALLERLADAAGLGFEQLDVRRLRLENTAQAALIADLRARLDERAAPPQVVDS